MNAKRRAGSLLLGVVLAGCAGTPGTLTPTDSSMAPNPIITTVPTATPAPTAAALTTSPLVAPSPTAVPLPEPTAAPTPASCVTLNDYVVVTGDTLWDIAVRNNTTLAALLAANSQVRDSRLIHRGDRLTISLLDLWSSARTLSSAFGINRHGQIVGRGAGAAIVWHDGETAALGSLGGSAGMAAAINNNGQVVGESATASYDDHAFLWQDGEMKNLGTLGGTSSEAGDINERGQVVGSSSTASGDTHAFLWQDGTMTDLGSLGGRGSWALAMNDRGQVVGHSTTVAGALHAFLWQDGGMTDLGTLGGSDSEATAINDRGQIVGHSMTKSGATHAVLWQDGVMTDLGTLGGESSWAFAINEEPDRFGGVTRGATWRRTRNAINERGEFVSWPRPLRWGVHSLGERPTRFVRRPSMCDVGTTPRGRGSTTCSQRVQFDFRPGWPCTARSDPVKTRSAQSRPV
jgi:probable HAF family extracellular repeat protein